MTKFFAIVTPIVTISLFAGWVNAAEPAPSPRCAVAKSTTFETTPDGRTVIVVKTVQVCK
jgi:hypothetical protein